MPREEAEFNLSYYNSMTTWIDLDRLLELLTLTRDDILRTVWGHDVFVTTRSVDRCISTLRAKIEPDPDEPQFITTVR